MKKAKLLTVLGVMLAMGVTACTGTGGDSNSKQPSTSPSSQPSQSASGDSKTSSTPSTTSSTPAPQIHIHELDGAEKVDILEEEGAVAEDMYKCKDCDKYAVAWSSLDYDVTKTTERSTKKPESRASGKAIRFDSTANYQDGDTTKKGCHIVYNVYLPEAVENANLMIRMASRNDTNDIFARYEDDNAKGYEYVPQASGDPKLERPATRYGLKLDGNVYIFPEDNTNQSWKSDIGWYQFPGTLPALTAGLHEVELYNLGGFRTEMYNLAIVGFGPHEHVENFKQVAAKTNDDGKGVYLGEDKFTGNKAIEIAFKDFHEAPATPDGENPWYMKKNTFATWTINVDKAIEGAKLYFSLQCASDTHIARHLFNEAKYNAEHPDAPVELPSQSPDTAEEDDWRYAVAVGETNYPILNDKTFGESGVKEANKQYYVYFADINLAAGANILKLTQCNMGYRMRFNQNIRIVYKGDAVITGEDYVPPHEHSWTVGDADANGVSPLTCAGCDKTGIQFDGFTGDNATAIDGDNKVTKKFEFKWSLNMPKAGKVALYMSFAYSAYNGGQKFGTGYALKVGETEGTVTLGDVAFNTLLQQAPTCTFIEIGTIDVPAGAIEFDYTHGNQGTRLISDKLVRLIYVD